MTGILITFEGPDGAGKSSALEAILPRLNALRDVVVTREPGGVRIAEEIREIILNPENTALDGKSEMLLFAAARRVHLFEKVRPALDAGKLVLMDRYIDSSVAYQGYGRGTDLTDIDFLNRFATDGLTPDLTLLFDIDTDQALERIYANRQDEVNRLDLERREMHHKVRQGYLALAAQEPERFVVIDAAQSFESVADAAFDAIASRLDHA